MNTQGDLLMIRLLIIADDFTGALDTGVQFAVCGAKTLVVTDTRYDFLNSDSSVLVLNAETRHLSPEEAYRIVFRAVHSALEAEIPYIYKKTDSALRGNIGIELTAVMEGAKSDKMIFIPAYPKMNRITVNGIQYIDGKPLAESVFGKDAFEPVEHSEISKIISKQSDTAVVLHSGLDTPEDPGIHVYDADSDKRMWEITNAIGIDRLQLTAGCAGFASVLPSMLGLIGRKPRLPQMVPELLVICGSINPISREQLDFAEKSGFNRIRLSPTQKLDPGWLDSVSCTQAVAQWMKQIRKNPCNIIDTNDAEDHQDTINFSTLSGFDKTKLRKTIASAIGIILKKLLDNGLDATIMIIGGDTLIGAMQSIGVSELQPVCELAPGTVLSQFKYKMKKYNVISKSGGFGEPQLLSRLAAQIGAEAVKEDAN